MLALNNRREKRTYQRVQEDIESSSGIHKWEIHDCIKLERSHLEAGVFARFAINGRELIVEVMLFLRNFQSVGELQ